MAYQTPPPPSQELLAKSVTPVTINSQSPPSVLSASPDLSPISMLKSLCTGEGSVSGNDDAALKANNSNAIGLELNSASSNTRGANLKVVKKTAKKGKEKDKQTYLGGDSFQNKGATASKKVGTTKRPRQKASKIEDRSVCKLAGHVTKAGTRHRVDQKSTTGKDDIWEIKSSPEREGLGLEVATARKKDWTPIKDQPSTIINLADSDGSPAGNNHGSTPQALSFLSAYNYQASTENTGSRHTGAPKMNPTTKHQIEFLNLIEEKEPMKPTAASKREDGKKKRRPKKATTITGNATDRYGSTPSSSAPNLLEYFPPENRDSKVTKKTYRKKAATNATNASAVSKVNTPEEVLNSLTDQQWIFGTSSQIEMEDCEDSIDEQATNSISDVASTKADSSVFNSAASIESRYHTSKNLWAASSRDLTGNTMRIPVLDLTDTYDAPIPHEENHHGILSDRYFPTLENKTSSISSVPPISENFSAINTTKASESKSDTIDGFIIQPEAVQSKERSETIHQPPSFSELTTAQLEKQIARFGFKRMTRKMMISTLQECWQMQHSTPTPASATTQVSTSESITETSGSDNYHQLHCDSKSSVDHHSPPERELINQHGSTTNSGNDQRKGVTEVSFATMTKAIRAEPRNVTRNGFRQLTWHEKMLIYDPIPLEDLTMWLNSQGLDFVGEDQEVSPNHVRKWCESKGVCCFYKK